MRISLDDDPLAVAAALVGHHAGLWRWRIDDYRVLAQVADERVTVLVMRVAHRREVYR